MKNKMKVMQIIPELGLGGAEIMLENLSMALKDETCDVHIVSLYMLDTVITKRLEEKGFKIHYLGKKRGMDLSIIVSLAKLFNIEKPQVIHTHRHVIQYAIPAAVISGVSRRVHTVHNVAEKETNKILRVVNKISYKLFNLTLVAISPKVKQTIQVEYKSEGSDIPMIYNGIYLEKYTPKVSYKSQDRYFNILHIGRFSEQKNHIGIIESFKQVCEIHNNVKLQLIGIGELEDEIKRKVKQLELENKVEFLGAQQDVMDFLNKTDIFILPSLWEGMPITLIEAMATGLPIVATEVGGVPDMIRHNQSGLLTKVDSKAVAEAIIKLLEDEKLREKIGKNALVEVQKFSAQEMARKYINTYL